jgi:hypothetical protein
MDSMPCPASTGTVLQQLATKFKRDNESQGHKGVLKEE